MKGKHLKRRAKLAAKMVEHKTDKVATALSLPSFREKKPRQLQLVKRKQFSSYNAAGKEKIRRGSMPLVWE